MIVVGSSAVPPQPRKRGFPQGLLPQGEAGNYSTGYMGRDYKGLSHDQQKAMKPTGEFFPMAYLIEQDPHSSLRSHFHVVDQFQVFVSGNGSLAHIPLNDICVQFVSPFSAYGPINAGDNGIGYITLRNGFDPGARMMPDARNELPRPRTYRQSLGGPYHRATEADLRTAASGSCTALIEEEADGMGVWAYRFAPNAPVKGLHAQTGRGQHWLVLAGSLSLDSREEALPRNSCVFLSPEESHPVAKAGPDGVEIILAQYPRR